MDIIQQTTQCLEHLINNIGSKTNEYHWREFSGLQLQLNEKFPNGAESYLETYYNIVAELSWMEAECTTFKSKLVDEIYESQGRKGLVELAQYLTLKFENKYKGETWEELDFYETINEFLNEELYEKA